MANIAKHWIVCKYTPADEEAQTLEAIDAPDLGKSYEMLPLALDRAKYLAALYPGVYYVVYEAQWDAYTDITPVAVEKVGAI